MSGRATLVLDAPAGGLAAAMKPAMDEVEEATALTFASDRHSSEDAETLVWQETEGLVAVSATDDRSIPARYVEVESEYPELLDAVFATLEEQLPHVPYGDLVRQARDTGDAASLMRLGVASGYAPDPRAVAAITAGLESDDIETLAAAAKAAALTRWPDFAEPLERARGDTGDEGVERLLDYAIANCGGGTA